jgi:hypothetical protein
VAARIDKRMLIATKLTDPTTPLHGLRTLSGALSELGALEAIAASVCTDARFHGTRFVIRRPDGERSALYAFGEPDDATRERLGQLASQLARVAHAARYVSYTEAERLTEVLAARLIDRYGRDELTKLEYRAIPRGGAIVLGMLAYALDLPADALHVRHDRAAAGQERPLVVVDDCVLSGMRLKQHLAFPGDRRVILAALFVPAALGDRTRVGNRPIDWNSAVLLDDLAPKLYGDGYSTWLDSWTRRLGDSVLWIGQPEHLCFAWSEPESAFVNAATGEVEAGFRLVPPNRCLRARSAPTAAVPEGSADRVEVHRDGPGPLNAPPHVVAAHVGGQRIAVARFAGDCHDRVDECYLLEESGADMWTQFIAHGTVEQASHILGSWYDAEPAAIAVDAEAFAEALVEMGLLVHG